MSSKATKRILDTGASSSKRFKALCQLTESGTLEEIKLFYQQQFSMVYNLFLDTLTTLNTAAKTKKKPIPTADVLSLTRIMLALFKHSRNIIQKRWQQRSIIHNLEAFLDDDSVFVVKKAGFELLIHFVDIMQDGLDETVMDLLMHALNFPSLIEEEDSDIKLPTFDIRKLSDDEKLRIQTGTMPLTEDEALQLISLLFNFIKAGDQFDFWWRFFKAKIAPILYPNECKSLDLLNKLDHMGFTKRCPHKIHLMVLDLILDSLESPKKAEVLYNTDKDIYLFLLIFRQSFLLPPQHYESISKMLKTYRAWICKDFFLYAWPDIMESSRNIYYRVFIDNLSQTFFMTGEESAMELHVDMCNEVMQIFTHFITIPDKIEFETWTDLLKAQMRIYSHLIQRKNSEEKYDQEFGEMLEHSCVRNLFVIWLKCHPNDDYAELWEGLFDMLQRLFTEPSLFHFWKITVLNLTRTMIKNDFKIMEDLGNGDYIPYQTEINDSSGKKSKKPKFTPRTDVVDLRGYFNELNEDAVMHMWHKMINMLGPNNLHTVGSIHARKISVIGEVIDLLLKISQIEVKVIKGTATPDFIHSPEINRMLELFIEWLLEACERIDSDFSEGRSIAFATLCKILCHRSSQPVIIRYLAACYRALHIGLNTKLGSTPRTLESILLNSSHIFSLGYKGVNILIPDYVKACEAVLKINSSSSLELRIAAIHTLVSVIHTCYYYDTITLPSLDVDGLKKTTEEEENISSRSFHQLRRKFCHIILGAVDDSRFEEVQIKCIWALFLIMQRELSTTSEDGEIGDTKLIIECLLTFAFDKNEKIALAAHSFFQAMGQLDLLGKLPSDVFTKLMTTLCGLITTNLTEGKLTRGSILVNLFYTIMEMIVYVPINALQQLSIARALFDAVSIGIDVGKQTLEQDDDRKKKTSKKSVKDIQNENAVDISEAAESLLAFILNMYNNFPSPPGATILSSDFSEFDLLSEEKSLVVPSPKLHHFVFNDYSLLTIMESPDNEETVRVVLRDMTGKYCWEHKFIITQSVSTFKRSDGNEIIEEEESDADDETASSSVTTPTKPQSPSRMFVQNDAGQSGVDDDNELPTIADDMKTRSQSTIGGMIPATASDEDDLPVVSEETEKRLRSQSLSTSDTADTPIRQQQLPTATKPRQATVENDEEVNDREEQQEFEYPHYDPEIDTDKTDMLEVLQHYVMHVFPECLEYSKPSVIKVEDQKIDISEEDKQMSNQLESEKRLVAEGEFQMFQTCEQPQKDISIIHKVFRAFLNSMGLLSLDNRPSFVRLDANHKFYRTLKQLDKLSERETMKIGLIYVANKQENERLILKNDDSSTLYKEFVRGLGWSVDLKAHKGFLGGLDNTSNLSTGDTAPYFSNATTEVIFHDLTRMPTKPNDTQQIHKKRHVGNDMVHIVWSEHDRDYRPWTIVSQFNFVHIVIYPLKYPLFRVQIFTKPDVTLFGPLLDGMVVDKQNLAPLVRLTAINANKAVRYSQQGYKRPFPTRRDMIDEICERYKQSNLSNEEYLRLLFFDQTSETDVVQSAFERRVRGITESPLRKTMGESEETSN